jgi:hypothetical protein
MDHHFWSELRNIYYSDYTAGNVPPGLESKELVGKEGIKKVEIEYWQRGKCSSAFFVYGLPDAGKLMRLQA